VLKPNAYVDCNALLRVRCHAVDSLALLATQLRTALELTARGRDDLRRRVAVLQDAVNKSINSFRYALVTMKVHR
jgi:hypothetical protein